MTWSNHVGFLIKSTMNDDDAGQPFLLNKPKIALDARPWRQFLAHAPDYAMPPGGCLTLKQLTAIVRDTNDVDDDWLMQTLARDERRALLFTYVPDLTMSLDHSPFVPSRLDAHTRARVVAMLLLRAFRPDRAHTTIDERWVARRLNPTYSRWFATLQDIIHDPRRYPEHIKTRAFRTHTCSHDQLERAWNELISGHTTTTTNDNTLTYAARMFVIARWIRALGFKHTLDFDTIVHAPDEEHAHTIAPHHEINLVGAPVQHLTQHTQRIQMSIYWMHGIVPDTVDDTQQPHAWKLKHASGFTMHELQHASHAR